ncbi:MAG: HAD family phosphatase [Proteobacteria bacterium]|nr:HAD family phosphatase [Pseudomonadota bacterium]
MSFELPFAAADIHGIIFDMDGLLLDSERVALATVATAAAELGLEWRAEVGLAMVGLNSQDGPKVIRHHLGEDYPVADLYDAFGRIYEEAIAAGSIPLKGGVVELFDVLDGLSLGRVVATSTRRSRAEPKLAAVGLLPRVHGMVCGDEVSRGKPAPDIFLAAAARLGVPVANCLVLEDSNAGVRGALAAGTRVVMVPDLLQPADDVRAAGVPVAVSLRDIAGFLLTRSA